MARAPAWVKYWLPVGLWMVVIFVASTGAFSSDNTSRVLGPILRWLVPDISEEAIRQAQLLVRKAAHAAEYFVLFLLVWRARRRPHPGDTRPWSWREAAFAFGFAVIYAITDELHQAWEPSRQGHVMDVAIDAAGAALGLLVAWVAVARARRKIPMPRAETDPAT